MKNQLSLLFISGSLLLGFQNCAKQNGFQSYLEQGKAPSEFSSLGDFTSAQFNDKHDEKYWNGQGFEIADDMILPKSGASSGQEKSTSVTKIQNFWPGGRVPVIFATDISADHRKIFWEGASQWNRIAGGVQFVERTNEPFALTVVNGVGCSATLGHYPQAPSVMTMQSTCWISPIVAHELGHAMGLVHEHQRPDRPKYLKLKPAGEANPWIRNMITTSINTPYDPTSVMHYCFSDSENFFEILPTAVFDASINVNNICKRQSNYKISYWDEVASKEIYKISTSAVCVAGTVDSDLSRQSTDGAKFQRICNASGTAWGDWAFAGCFEGYSKNPRVDACVRSVLPKESQELLICTPLSAQVDAGRQLTDGARFERTCRADGLQWGEWRFMGCYSGFELQLGGRACVRVAAAAPLAVSQVCRPGELSIDFSRQLTDGAQFQRHCNSDGLSWGAWSFSGCFPGYQKHPRANTCFKPVPYVEIRD